MVFASVSSDSVLEPVEFKNHKSSSDDKVKKRVEQLIQKEIDLGNYVITAKKPTIHVVIAVGEVPKGDSDIRFIHDCVYQLEGFSIILLQNLKNVLMKVLTWQYL